MMSFLIARHRKNIEEAPLLYVAGVLLLTEATLTEVREPHLERRATQAFGE